MAEFFFCQCRHPRQLHGPKGCMKPSGGWHCSCPATGPGAPDLPKPTPAEARHPFVFSAAVLPS